VCEDVAFNMLRVMSVSLFDPRAIAGLFRVLGAGSLEKWREVNGRKERNGWC